VTNVTAFIEISPLSKEIQQNAKVSSSRRTMARRQTWKRRLHPPTGEGGINMHQ